MSFGTFYTVLAAFEGIAVWGGMKNIPVREALDHVDGTIQRLASPSGVAIGKIWWRCIEHFICVVLAPCARFVPWVPILFFVLSPLAVLGCSYWADIDVETEFTKHEKIFVGVGFWTCSVQLLLLLGSKLWFSRYEDGVLSDAKPKDGALTSL